MSVPQLSRCLATGLLGCLFGLGSMAPLWADDALVSKYLTQQNLTTLVPGAESFELTEVDFPVATASDASGQVLGHIYLTSDFVSTTGYSGKPIHVLVGLDAEAKITGVELADHSEPIVLIGIPESKITGVMQSYIGLDLVAEAQSETGAHELDIVSGATVTLMIIDDSIVRAGLKVSRNLGLGGLEAERRSSGPSRQLTQPVEPDVRGWMPLAGDGSIRALSLDVGQVNEAFRQQGDERAIARPEKGKPTDTFIELQGALVSVPSIGLSLLGKAEFNNLTEWLEEGEHAMLLMGRGRYSFKGSGYVRGGIFDRIQLIQGDVSVRFFDKQHRRLGTLATRAAPKFKEIDLFRIPADTSFDPTEPFRVQLLVQRAVGAIDKTFLTFDLGYRTPEIYLEELPAATADATTQPLLPDNSTTTSDSDTLTHLWPRIWEKRKLEVAVLVVALLVLSGVFFFQMQLTRHERFTTVFRMCFLVFTLFGIGWYANAQLSVVNLLTLFKALTSGFSWEAFLMDPLIFVLWFAVAVSLVLWGRGAYCGWLCPFGALQELTNRLARLAHIPQVQVPWSIHERLWALKYIIFMTLFGMSLYSLELAERFAEIEPFKTAIILKFMREWPFVTFAMGLLVVGLFIERFYCRYLCPLGAALAIPARLRTFDWLKRYHECGTPCARCANECMVQAIDPLGQISPNECHQCMHCQVLYQSKTKCPVCIQKEKRRNRVAKSDPNAEPATWVPPGTTAALSAIPVRLHSTGGKS